jgi:hypothetical protein
MFNEYKLYKTATQTIEILPEKNYVRDRICAIVDLSFTDTADGAQSLEETNS